MGVAGTVTQRVTFTGDNEETHLECLCYQDSHSLNIC